MAVSLNWGSEAALRILGMQLSDRYATTIAVHSRQNYLTGQIEYGFTANGGIKAGPFDSLESMAAACKLMFGEKA